MAARLSWVSGPLSLETKYVAPLPAMLFFRLRLCHDVQTELGVRSVRKSTPNAFMRPESNKRFVESTSTTTQAPQSSMWVRGLVDSDAFWVQSPQGSTESYSAVGGRR